MEEKDLLRFGIHGHGDRADADIDMQFWAVALSAWIIEDSRYDELTLRQRCQR